MYYGSGKDSLVTSSLLEAFALALLRQRARDEWYQNVITGLSRGGTVVAGIILEFVSNNSNRDDTSRFICVSLGSGTRCVGYEPPKQFLEADLLLRDGHAEVMARRGFIAFLLDAAEYLAQDETRQHPFVEFCSFMHLKQSETSNNSNDNDAFPWRCFRLRDGVKLHLVCTESPCGAMSMPHGGGRVLLRTPSGHSLLVYNSRGNTNPELTKELMVSLNTAVTLVNSNSVVDGSSNVVVCHGHTMAAHRSHPADGLLLVSRVKPGKGHQNLCMSCSDKLLRWHCLGMQGRRRTRLFPERIRFKSIWLPEYLDDADRMDDSFSLEDVARALNDRRQYFVRENTSPRKGNNVSDGTRCVLYDMQVAPYVPICGFTPSSLLSLLTQNNVSLTREKGGDGGNGSNDEKKKNNNNKKEKVDCCWSRSAWLTFTVGRKSNVLPLLGVKRCRKENDKDYNKNNKNKDDDDINEADATHHSFAWLDSNVAVLNTKAGLPRGITRQCMERTAQQMIKLQTFPFKSENEKQMDEFYSTVEMMADRFPLSRLWMAQRQRKILQLLLRQLEPKGIALQRTPTLYGVLSGDKVENDVDHSFVKPVNLIPVGMSKEGDGIVAGGSVHYWLQQSHSNKNHNNNSNGDDTRVLERSEDEMCHFPLLWVEKGISMSSCE
ncbi:Adenosine deaminase/editase [Trypanosoma melophagium]|uniref:Adenosine deaminase/editase n=1 Tax=Trypanosoma melophagium TaxID=715481 RepID=UPI003519F33D|nr:Adenosine deaminase/editase [Trypanosoma melophagium]